jgi:hypothetical protein
MLAPGLERRWLMLAIGFAGTFASWTEGMLRARAKLIAENIHRTARGEPPMNLIPSPA